MERIVYTSMSDGVSSLGAVSDDLRPAVDEAHEAILSGDLALPLVIEPIE